MMAEKPANQKDSRLLERYLLLSRLAFEPKVCRRHFLVYQFILEYWYSDYGNAFCSLELISKKLKEKDPYGKGFARQKIAPPIADLIKWGYLERLAGTGTGKKNASKYVPNWSLLSVTTVGDISTATPTLQSDCEVAEMVSIVTNSGDRTVTESGDTKGIVVTTVGDQDPATLTRLQPMTVEGGINESPPAATSALPLDAAGGDGFERIYTAYGVRAERAKARAEFNKLDANAELVGQIVEAAKAWAASGYSGKHGRKHLATWLKEERYLEDAPKSPSFKKPIAKAAQAVAKPIIPIPQIAPVVFNVVSASNDGSVISLENADGEKISITYSAASSRDQDEGQRQLGLLANACGLKSINDANQLLGKRFIKRGEDFLPAPANDNQQLGEIAA